MDFEARIELVKRNSEEIITDEKLAELLKGKKHPITYCGYETSGGIHLGHLVTITKLLDLQNAGFKVKILFADWHTWLNQKGDWDFIHETTKQWERGFKAAGLKEAEFVLGSRFQRKMNYIDDVMALSLKTTINRALRSMQQVARDVENAKVSQVIYPFMQIADIKWLKIDLVQAGIEQRKIHALGIELLPEIKCKVPVFVHTPLIPSLTGSGKMSSSIPASMISINESDEEIRKKIKAAYCKEGEKENNPILSIAKLIIFPRFSEFKIERPEKFRGNINFIKYEELEKEFTDKKIHPADLKEAVSKHLTEIIRPIRENFEKD